VAYLTANRSEGKLNFNKLQQACITSLRTVLNSALEAPRDALYKSTTTIYYYWIISSKIV